MARKRGKKALYEVMSKARVKPDYGKTVEPLYPSKKQEKVPAADDSVVEKPEIATKWRKKPRIVQYNFGRIEFSIPYQLAITLGLLLILFFLLSFKFGQLSNNKVAEPTVSDGQAGRTVQERPATRVNPESSSPRSNNTSVPPANREVAPASSTGDNVIVLAEYHAMRDLIPVRDFFQKNLISTEIDLGNERYFLQTVERFNGDPTKSGNDGYDLFQEIKRIGKGYKAPDGYESFAPHFFSDAYGKNIEN